MWAAGEVVLSTDKNQLCKYNKNIAMLELCLYNEGGKCSPGMYYEKWIPD